MSKSALIIVTDECEDDLYFYRHYDATTDIIIGSLSPLLEKIKSKELRRSTQKFSGWIIVAGHKEYYPDGKREDGYSDQEWKVGAYEPVKDYNLCVNYRYELNLHTLEINLLGSDLRKIKTLHKIQ
jgi:hypothetical protein